MLPNEVLAQVFLQLPVEDLDRVSIVCRRWNSIVNESIWCQKFVSRFSTNQITPISSKAYNYSWRRELLLRHSLLQSWKKNSKSIDITLNSQLFDVTHTVSDFNLNRVICFNAHKGKGIIFDMRKGSEIQKFYASSSRQSMPVSCADGSRFAFAYGNYDGTVGFNLFPRISELSYQHSAAVTAIYIAKNVAHTVSTGIWIATGSTDGSLMLTNMRSKRTKTYSLDAPVERIFGDLRAKSLHSVIVLCRNKQLYEVSFDSLRLICSLNESNDSIIDGFVADNYAILYSEMHLYSVNLQYSHSDDSVYHAKLGDSSSTSDYDNLIMNPYIKYPHVSSGGGGIKTEEYCVFKSETPIRSISCDKNLDSKYGYYAVATAQDVFIYKIGLTGCLHKLTKEDIPEIPSDICKIALNALTLLISGFNGKTLALDLLAGVALRRVNSRISKSVLDFRAYNTNSLPTTYLEVNPECQDVQCVIGVKGAVQCFTLKGRDVSKDIQVKYSTRDKRKPVLRRASRDSITRDINELRAIQIDDDDAFQRSEAIREEFHVADLDEDEQLRLALMMSESAPASHSVTVDQDLDEDTQLQLALAMSQQDEGILNEDEMIALATRLSLS